MKLQKETIMKREDPAAEILEPLLNQSRETKDDLTALRKIEKSGNSEAFREAIANLDRKTKHRGLERTKGLDQKLINQKAFMRAAASGATQDAMRTVPRLASSSLLAELFQTQAVRCDCVVPFTWMGLNAYGNMTGPDRNDVFQGILGANREYTGEYTVTNPGDTEGKGRVPLNGQLHMSFEATIPQGGRWCLLMPAGNLWVRGHSKVVGQGNSTTSYDAKVWIDYYQLLIVRSTLVEIGGGEIHYDGTRSESRTKYFEADVVLGGRYLFFNASSGDQVVLSLRIEVDTAANEDGTAVGTIDYFGFPANTRTDYDTFLIRA